ncbi:MAG: hypothetical protein E7516_03085 [Ruminococcaceae bacterium]|nr:hypothetical protein [Oscillospiraceae bacterium]
MANMTIKREDVTLKSDNGRLAVFDVVKGLGMLLVIYAHVNYQPEVLTTIYSFHMPLFFIVSGMLFDRKRFPDFKSFITRKAVTLICPYVLFYLLSILYLIAVKLIAEGFGGLEWQRYFTYFLQMFLSQGSARSVNAPLWFVPCLFATEIIYFFISVLNKKLILLICALLSALGWVLESGLLPFDNTLLPWSLDSALFATGFYALGNILSDNVKAVLVAVETNKKKKLICMAITLIFLVITVCVGLYNGKISLGSKILNNGFLLYLSGITGTISVFAAALIFEKNKLLQYIGKNSFYIMSVHYLIREFILLCCRSLDIPKYNKASIVETIIPVLLVFAFSLLFTFVYNQAKCFIQRKIKS